VEEGTDEALWCRRCGQPARRDGDADEDPLVRRAVHAATGDERGAPDGHLVAPVDFEPPLWRAAREIAAEFRGLFTLTARLGVLRADWADPPLRVTARHYTAEGPGAEAGMRAQLRRALIAAGIAPPAGAGADAEAEATIP